MSASRSFLVLQLASLVGSSAPVSAGPPIKDLLAYFPDGTNAIMRVQVNDIIKSPRGLREKWGQKQNVEYLAGAIPLHPNIERLVVGTKFEPHRREAGWSISLIPTLKEASLENLATKMQGKIEDLGDDKIIATKQFGYFAQLNPEVLGNVTSSDRQFCSKWLKFARANKNQVIGNYLSEAVIFNDSAQILLAVETDDMIDPQGLLSAISASKLFDEDPKLRDAAQKFLVSLRGVRIAVNFGETTRATIKLDSKADTVPGLTVLKPFLLKLMEHNGTMLEDMPGAKVQVVGRSVIFDLALSDSDLMKITAILGSPMVHPKIESLSATSSSSIDVTPDADDPIASHRYFRTVNQYVAELRRNAQLNPKPMEANKHARWYEVYANKLSQVSVLNVDPAVLAYGQSSQKRFQAIGESLRGIPIELDKLESKKYYYQSGLGFWRYPSNVSTNIPELDAQQYALIEKDQQNRDHAWKMIDNQRKDVRTKMQAKYKIDFEEPLK